MTNPLPNHRWYHLTPDRFLLGLLVVQVFLFLSEQFQWFAFNKLRTTGVKALRQSLPNREVSR